jgi:hypothetical protein
MRIWALAAAAVVASAGAASAQQPFVYKPIDTNALIVQPVDATTSGSRTTIRSLARSVAGAIEQNGFVRTVNNLLGTRATPPTVQQGFSPLPLPNTYSSSRYANSFTPMVPRTSTFGQSPNVPLPAGTITGR